MDTPGSYGMAVLFRKLLEACEMMVRNSGCGIVDSLRQYQKEVDPWPNSRAREGDVILDAGDIGATPYQKQLEQGAF